jgi:PAB1-binding protein PBP1
MAQSYVGKPAISKGIGRAIRKFVAFGFSADFPGRQRGACAVPDG